MDRIQIRGGAQLNGVIPISGAKNAALPLMIASLLTDQNSHAGEPAAPRRREPACADPRQPRRRLFDRRQTRPRRGGHRTDGALAGAHGGRYDRPLRARVAYAGELLGDRAAHRPHGRGAGVTARRLRDRHPSGRSAADGADETRRVDRDRRGLCGRQSAEGASRRGDRLSQGDGRRDACRDDGGLDGARRDPHFQCGAGARDRRRRRLPQQDGRAHPRRGNLDDRDRRRPAAQRRASPRPARPDRGGHLRHRRRDDRRRRAA